MSKDSARYMIDKWVDDFAVDKNAKDQYAPIDLVPNQDKLKMKKDIRQAMCDIVVILYELSESERHEF